MNRDEVKEKIFSALEKSALNQTKIAERLGVTQSAFNRRLHGGGADSIEFISEIAHVLEIPLQNLLFGEDFVHENSQVVEKSQLKDNSDTELYDFIYNKEKISALEKRVIALLERNNSLNDEKSKLYEKITELQEKYYELRIYHESHK